MNNSLDIDLALDENKVSLVKPNNPIKMDIVKISVPKNIDLSTFNILVTIEESTSDTIFTLSYPDNNVILFSTDQDYITAFNFNFIPDKTYSITVKHNYLNQEHVNTFTYVGDRFESPYPSWIWRDGNWHAPIPLPDDAGDIMSGELYEWNEEELLWIPAGGYTVE